LLQNSFGLFKGFLIFGRFLDIQMIHIEKKPAWRRFGSEAGAQPE
jgi:hypothetical protein